MGDIVKTMYPELMERYFAPVVQSIDKTINDKKAEEQLLVLSLFRSEYSPTLTWESVNINSQIVAADVISMNSSLPLKSRDALATASGKIPKLGLKFSLDEETLKLIMMLEQQGRPQKEIAGQILEDTPRVIYGILHQLEILAQQGLSSGLVSVTDKGMQGIGIRLQYKSRATNTMKAPKKWGTAGCDPVKDLRGLFDQAETDGNAIQLVLLDAGSIDSIRSSEAGRRLIATQRGMYIADPNAAPEPNRSDITEALQREFGAEFRVVKSNIRVQKADGGVEQVKPWAEGAVVGIPNKGSAGRLFHTSVVEESRPVAGVLYEKAQDFILVSKYSKNDPFAEFTAGQAMAFPVLDNVDGIYRLNTIF